MTAVAIASVLPALAVAGEASVGGDFGGEIRGFVMEPAFDMQFERVQASIFIEPEFVWESDDRDLQVSFVPFGRLDSADFERSHFDLREAYFLWIGDGVEVLFGVNRVFHGVTESLHLVDIVNVDDFVEDIDEEAFLGQPMLNVAFQQDFGRFDLFYFPAQRESTFPSEEGRLRFALPVAEDDAIFATDLEEFQPGFLGRYSHFIGDIDLGVNYYYGLARDPRFVLSEDFTELVPVYDLIHQGSVDAQYTIDAWLLKFEGLVRADEGPVFLAAVGGFEYTWFQAFDTDMDIGLLGEYLFDGRDPDESGAAPFEDDFFAGMRFAMNDTADTDLLIGGVVDRETGGTAMLVEGNRRLSGDWSIELISRIFFGFEEDDVLESFEQDTFVELSLIRGF